MTDAPVLFETKNGVALITLNRPDKLNSFNVAQHIRLREILDVVESDPSIRCLLLTGAGRGFCAGQDLSDRDVSPGSAPVDLGETIATYYTPLIKRLHNSKIPTICAVNGVAAGAGANLALACDIVLAAKSAKFVQVFSNIGLIPDSGGTYILPRNVGQARAMGLALLATPLKAEQAKDWGLIWDVCEDDTLMNDAFKMAVSLADRPTLGFALTRKLIRQSFDNDIDTQLENERAAQQKAGFSADYKEGVSAFMNKRKPVFQGK
ncbi:MAG: 2-(1,2-epoxy-1,2-dihydrophenyl)acetyl-CoA isomerase [Robiginitomaculum sp.]|nr:MAG: 2-(1,2-epoxy-1,2-dihydrophenyl)acetyl-CoA isomerase [Robiginitomaculum sp.]